MRMTLMGIRREIVGMRLALLALMCATVLAGESCTRREAEPEPAQVATAREATVLYQDRAVTLARTLDDPNDLWVVPDDLPRINDFVLKPEGACLNELCVPVRQDRDSEIFVTRSAQGWFNVTELARRLQQPYVADAEHAVWSFGKMPVTRTAFMQSAMAPDFALPNREGKTVRLSDFRGKKVLLVTWASW